MKILAFPFKTKSVISDDEARRMTRLFLDGDTSAEQEKKLYDYFAQRKVASDLECYREMFGWYAGLESASKSTNDNRRHRTRLIAVAASISALLLIGVGLIAGLPKNSGSLSPDGIYAGSYIIRNGKKITDIKQILPELRQADRYIDSTLSAFNRPAVIDPEKSIISDALRNIDDPEIKAMLLADIN
ncbi:MAG: hypothetical protein K2J10_01350 [Muribaculaceae bacterium]|nr:hypothetical protein [Muribaculaceae bacterium]